jgi:hypothetical protein
MFLELFLSVLWGFGASAIFMAVVLPLIITKKISKWYLAGPIVVFPVAVFVSSILIVGPSLNYDIDCKTYNDYFLLIRSKDRIPIVPISSFNIRGQHTMANWEVSFNINKSEFDSFIASKPNGLEFTQKSSKGAITEYGTPVASNGAHISYSYDSEIGFAIGRCSRW